MDWKEADEQRDDEKGRVGGGRCDKAEICISIPLDSAEFLKMVLEDTLERWAGLGKGLVYSKVRWMNGQV